MSLFKSLTHSISNSDNDVLESTTNNKNGRIIANECTKQNLGLTQTNNIYF